ncbi:MAG: PQQ-like beta-propeller repeat protein [Verrucomicrobiales bacterium]|nr:PQQ-like beta-propeller repeat protein [Verrucomicrobiales bacterium]
MLEKILHLASIFWISLAASQAEEQWSQWRGSLGLGHAPAANDLPVHWTEKEKVKWFSKIPGRGYSSPVISGQQIWVTTAIESVASEDQAQKRLQKNTGNQPLVLLSHVSLRALCLDRSSGKILYDVELLALDDPQWVHKLNSYASPSPVLSKGRLFCHFGALGSACVDTQTGKLIWTNTEIKVNHENGPGSTPVVWKDLMIFHMDGSDQQFIVALNTKDGKVVWKTKRSGELRENPQLRKSYATPLLVEVDEKTQLISPSADWLYAYDPETGRELWKFKYGKLGFSNVPRPVFGDGVIYLSTGFGKTEILALRLNGEQMPTELWRHKKGAPRMPSPILVGDLLYFVSDSGIFSCLKASEGKAIWQQRLKGNYASSPLFADGHLYLGSQEGQMQVFSVGEEYKLLAENEMGSAIMASPVALGKALYIRTVKGLYRIEK